MSTQSRYCRGPVSRRGFLEIGGLATCGLGLGGMMQARAASTPKRAPSNDNAVIFVWLSGGPPHMEMYDMKPDAPAEYRGAFAPVNTNVPGIDVCELFPFHRRCADKYTIIRSVHHGFADHGGGHKRFLTGRKPKEPTGFVNDAPMVGSFINKALEQRKNPNHLPNYIALIRKGRDKVDTFSFGSAWMGTDTHPFIVNGDPNDQGFAINNLSLTAEMADRLDDRTSLLKGLDRLRRDVDSSGRIDSLDAINQQAMAMLTSDQIRAAFDLSGEDPKLRNRYGRHGWGQRAILARRLVEAGAPFVTVVMENPYISGIRMPNNGVYNWDSHAVNCHLFDDAKWRFPIYDRVVTALIEDLYQRGLDKRVLLVVTGEFGRTPKIRHQVGSRTKVSQPGRDHWPRSMSMLVSGGGMRTGQIIGATDKLGQDPVERALTPNDLWSSILHHLGIDQEMTFPNHQGQPLPILPFGSPIKELWG